MKKKVKVFWYKEGCHPRILINPSQEALVQIHKEEGIVLTNPNEGSVKGLSLAHTYPDTKNNMLRPIPIAYRSNIKALDNPIKVARRENDEALAAAVALIKSQKLRDFAYKAQIELNIENIEKDLDTSVSDLGTELEQIHSELATVYEYITLSESRTKSRLTKHCTTLALIVIILLSLIGGLHG